MSSDRQAFRELSLTRDELFEERYRKASDALARVEAELTARDEEQAARELSLRGQVHRYALTANTADRLEARASKEDTRRAVLLAFAAGALSVPAIVGLLALIRAIF